MMSFSADDINAKKGIAASKNGIFQKVERL
jgi:hypothetical protein